MVRRPPVAASGLGSNGCVRAPQFAQTSKSRLAARLFAAGNAEAQVELPLFDTGSWSLYQPGIEDDLSYHELVTGFLQQLCAMTKARIYCATAAHFQRYLKRYLKTHTALRLLTSRSVAPKPESVYFWKRTTVADSAEFPDGTGSFQISPLAPDSQTAAVDFGS